MSDDNLHALLGLRYLSTDVDLHPKIARALGVKLLDVDQLLQLIRVAVQKKTYLPKLGAAWVGRFLVCMYSELKTCDAARRDAVYRQLNEVGVNV